MPNVHKRKKVSESVARPARTVIQATPAFLITELIDSFHDLTDYQFGLVVLILTAGISWVQTTVENELGKGLLRQVPPTEAPLVDE